MLIAGNRKLMGDHANERVATIPGWLTAALMAVALMAVALMAVALMAVALMAVALMAVAAAAGLAVG